MNANKQNERWVKFKIVKYIPYDIQMRIIIITADTDESRISNLGAYIKKNYNIKYFYVAPTKNSLYTNKIIKDFINAPSEIDNKLTIKFKKGFKDNIEDARKNLIDIDLSERTEKYKELYEKLHEETDEQIGIKLRTFFNTKLLNKLKSVQTPLTSSASTASSVSAVSAVSAVSNEQIESVSSLVSTNCKGYDIAVICEFIVANSIIEEIYKINKYHAYARSVDNKIYTNISVINTKTKLLEFYNYSYFNKN